MRTISKNTKRFIHHTPYANSRTFTSKAAVRLYADACEHDVHQYLWFMRTGNQIMPHVSVNWSGFKTVRYRSTPASWRRRQIAPLEARCVHK